MVLYVCSCVLLHMLKSTFQKRRGDFQLGGTAKAHRYLLKGNNSPFMVGMTKGISHLQMSNDFPYFFKHKIFVSVMQLNSISKKSGQS